MKKLKFILDFDGVLTTGQFLYSHNGKAYKIFGPHDADGLKMIRPLVDIEFISADKRGFSISQRRARDMGYPINLVSEQNRLEFIRDKYILPELIFMGDGLFDVPVLKACKFGIAPASARKEAKRAAHFVTESNAGEGAVCDACLEIKRRFFKKNK